MISSFAGCSKNYPIFLSDHWLITKRRIVVVAHPMMSCCRRLPTHPDWYLYSWFGGRFDRVDRVNIVDRTDGVDRVDRGDGVDGVDRFDKVDSVDRVDRGDRFDRVDMIDIDW